MALRSGQGERQSKGGEAGLVSSGRGGGLSGGRTGLGWTSWGSETLPFHYPFLHQSLPCLPLRLWDPQGGLTPEVPAWES